VANELRVDCAALRGDDGVIYSAARPARHHDVIEQARRLGYDGPVSGDRQGFLLSDGRFTWRKPALAVARRAGQLIREPTAPGHGLFSEDVW
jgi:hypothetical protein